MTFTAQAPFDPSHPHALALYCSDGRFTESVEELVHGLGHPRLDTVTLPGGPALLNVLNAGFVELQAVSNAVSFLVRAHAITHVFLLAHEGCGYYRARMTGATPEAIAKVQHADLAVAEKAIAGLHSEVTLQRWFARPDKGRVLFEPA